MARGFDNFTMGGLVSLVLLIVAAVVILNLFTGRQQAGPVGLIDRVVQAPAQIVDRTIVNPLQRIFQGGQGSGVQGILDPMPRSEMYRNFY